MKVINSECNFMMRLYDFVYGYNLNGDLQMCLPVHSACGLCILYNDNFSYNLVSTDMDIDCEAVPFKNGFSSIVPAYTDCKNAKNFYTLYDQVANESMADIDAFSLTEYRAGNVRIMDSNKEWDILCRNEDHVLREWQKLLMVYRFMMYTSEPVDIVKNNLTFTSKRNNGNIVVWNVMRDNVNFVGLAVLVK